MPLIPRPVHDHGDPDQAEAGSDQVGWVWGMSVNSPAPEEREDDEDASVSRIDSPEVRRLQCGNNSVKEKNQTAKCPYQPTALLAQPQPH